MYLYERIDEPFQPCPAMQVLHTHTFNGIPFTRAFAGLRGTVEPGGDRSWSPADPFFRGPTSKKG